MSTIAIAAKWWADRLRSETGLGDNGARDLSSVMAMGMVGMIRKRHPVTDEHARQFERHLVRLIALALDAADEYEAAFIAGKRPDVPDIGCQWYFDNVGWNAGGPDLCLSVDYHPCGLLSHALELAGIERNVREVAALPCKTNLRVSRRHVIASAGYGAPWTDVACLWGSSLEEQSAVDAARDDLCGEDVWNAWRTDGRRGPSPVMCGPIQQGRPT